MSAALAAFVVVFLAEFGDRTQLLVIGLAARHKAAPVFGGLVLGYAVTNLLSVVVGAALGATLPERTMALVGGLAFLGFAIWTLRGTSDEEDDAVADRPYGTGAWRLMLGLSGAVMVSELGDKSMLATATLAADGNPVAVWIGATLGVISAGGLGVAAGRLLADRVPHVLIRRVSAALFTVFGVALLLRAW